MKKPLSMPNVKKYIHVAEYLKDYCEYRKSLDLKFSYDIWAAELGFNSRSYLRMIIKKQRMVSLQFAKVFSVKENLSTDQADYLNLITSYQLKNSPASQRKLYMEKILEHQEIESPYFEIKDYQKFLAVPYLSQIFLLLTFDDFIKTSSHLKKITLLPDSEIKKSLNLLKKLGLVESKTENSLTTWIPISKSFKILPQAKDKSILSFHKNTLAEAKLILKTNPFFRHFRSVYFSMADEDVDAFKNECEVFLTKMKKKYSGNSIKNKRLVKLNLNAYPVSEMDN